MPATILLTVALLAAAVVLMGVKALFVKGGRFPRGHSHELRDIPRRQRALRDSLSSRGGRKRP